MPDREKAIKGLESLRDICNAKSDMAIGKGKIAWVGYANAADDALSLLKEQPEIVRCKDCVFRDARDGMCEHVQQMRDPDWYCADGERRDNDG